MPCNSPLAAFQEIGGGSIHFKETPNSRPLKLPCGRCWGCRLERSKQWAMRCVHEASLHENNCFVTLTYSDEELPPNGSLHKPHLQKFFKRLRKERGELRYYACGEYGDETQRAHYHACLFGIDFEDRKFFRKIGEHRLDTSEQLERIWGHGQCTVGTLTFESAAYTARYVMKKQLGKGGQRYVEVNEETGEITDLVQPYAAMSLRPAIASQWLRRYGSDIYGHHKDHLYMRGVRMKPPRYYDKIYDTINPVRMEEIKQQRLMQAEPKTDQQLHAREAITRARYISRKQV